MLVRPILQCNRKCLVFQLTELLLDLRDEHPGKEPLLLKVSLL